MDGALVQLLFNVLAVTTERSPPLGAATWPRHGSLPLTYYPVPDIA